MALNEHIAELERIIRGYANESKRAFENLGNNLPGKEEFEVLQELIHASRPSFNAWCETQTANGFRPGSRVMSIAVDKHKQGLLVDALQRDYFTCLVPPASISRRKAAVALCSGA